MQTTITSTLLTLMLFIALQAGSCRGQQTIVQQPVTGSVFDYKVTGCASVLKIDENNPPVRLQKSAFSNELPQLTMAGDSLVYQRYESHLCCRKVIMTAATENKEIIFIENWSGMGCKCKCDSQMKAVLRKLTAGTYRVLVIRKGTDPFDDKTPLQPDTLYNAPMTIR
jgi:hypothetical protein